MQLHRRPVVLPLPQQAHNLVQPVVFGQLAEVGGGVGARGTRVALAASDAE